MGSVFMPVDKCTRENSCLQVGQHGDGDDDDGVDNDGPVDGDDNDDYHDSQVLAGSHLMGRVDHFLMGEQSGADPERVQLTRICIVTEDLWKQKEEQMSSYKAAVQVEMAKKFGCKHIFVEMDPGDALFFHSNLFHTRCLNVNRDSSYSSSKSFSDQNKSDLRRWVMISSYNQVTKCPCQSQKSIDVTFSGSE